MIGNVCIYDGMNKSLIIVVYFIASWSLQGTFGEPEIFTGEVNRARLGFSIAAIGDINLDGYNGE